MIFRAYLEILMIHVIPVLHYYGNCGMMIQHLAPRGGQADYLPVLRYWVDNPALLPSSVSQTFAKSQLLYSTKFLLHFPPNSDPYAYSPLCWKESLPISSKSMKTAVKSCLLFTLKLLTSAVLFQQFQRYGCPASILCFLY